MTKLVLIRGLPGSGKSTLACTMTDEAGVPFFHVEADMYFCRHNGEYLFNPAEIPLAHDWCQHNATLALEKGQNVVVSNTFTQQWEMKPYALMAKQLGAEFEVVEATGDYQNIHGVPEDALKRMKARWQLLPQYQIELWLMP